MGEDIWLVRIYSELVGEHTCMTVIGLQVSDTWAAVVRLALEVAVCV